MKQVSLCDFLTDGEIRTAIEMWNSKDRSTSYTRDVCEKIILPNMARINRALGQENNAMYLAYLVTYVVTDERRRL